LQVGIKVQFYTILAAVCCELNSNANATQFALKAFQFFPRLDDDSNIQLHSKRLLKGTASRWMAIIAASRSLQLAEEQIAQAKSYFIYDEEGKSTVSFSLPYIHALRDDIDQSLSAFEADDSCLDVGTFGNQAAANTLYGYLLERDGSSRIAKDYYARGNEIIKNCGIQPWSGFRMLDTKLRDKVGRIPFKKEQIKEYLTI